jgi:Tol biopolymer transport system component
LARRDVTPSSWSPDGRHLAVVEKDRVAVLTFGSGEPETTAISDIEDIWEQAPAFSPDGRWLLYQSTMERRGRFDIYARQYPGPGEPIRLSSNGGESPTWNPKGGEVFYVEPQGRTERVMSVTFEAGRVGTPRLLFETDERLRFGCRPVPCYAVSPRRRPVLHRPDDAGHASGTSDARARGAELDGGTEGAGAPGRQ